jgi:hypothetical protein
MVKSQAPPTSNGGTTTVMPVDVKFTPPVRCTVPRFPSRTRPSARGSPPRSQTWPRPRCRFELQMAASLNKISTVLLVVCAEMDNGQVSYEVRRSYSGEVGRLVALTPAKFPVHAVVARAAIPRESVAAERKALTKWPHAAASQPESDAHHVGNVWLAKRPHVSVI